MLFLRRIVEYVSSSSAFLRVKIKFVPYSFGPFSHIPDFESQCLVQILTPIYAPRFTKIKAPRRFFLLTADFSHFTRVNLPRIYYPSLR